MVHVTYMHFKVILYINKTLKANQIPEIALQKTYPDRHIKDQLTDLRIFKDRVLRST